MHSRFITSNAEERNISYINDPPPRKDLGVGCWLIRYFCLIHRLVGLLRQKKSETTPKEAANRLCVILHGWSNVSLKYKSRVGVTIVRLLPCGTLYSFVIQSSN